MAFINTKYHYLERHNSIKRYKRRIMVGDNLSNTNVFADFSNNYSPMEIDTEPIYIVKTNGTTSIEEDTSGRFGRSNPYVGSTSIVPPNNYIFYGSANSGNAYNNKRVFLDSNKGAGVVISVESANEFYRHLYVEDPKIRPLREGDIVKKGTRLYFTFPDTLVSDYYNYRHQEDAHSTQAASMTMGQWENVTNLVRVNFTDNDDETGYTKFTVEINPFGTTSAEIFKYPDTEVTLSESVYVYNDDEITRIEYRSSWADFWDKYIYVDETTLATSNSFRQVQVGDKVSDTYFIYDFNELKKDILEAPGMGSNLILEIEEDADIEMTKINNTFSLSFYYVGGMPQIFRASYDTDGQTIDITNDLFKLSDKITDATSGDVTITNETWKVVNDTTFTKYMKVLK